MVCFIKFINADKTEELAMFAVKAVTVPGADFLSEKSIAPYFRDALQVTLTKPELSAAQVQYRVFSQMPKWVDSLMSLRNRIVKHFGFDVASSSITPNNDQLKVGDAVGFMTVIRCDEKEIVSFAEDKHMQFYLSVSKCTNRAVISTLVNKKTLFGRIYVTAIIPFHWLIARVVINQATVRNRI